jgi:hypothetical protein
MVLWLAEQVGERGHVVATDVDVTYLERLDLPNVEVRPTTFSRIRWNRSDRSRSTWCRHG